MKTHTTISGQSIEFEPTEPVANFLEQIERMVEDEGATENEMIALAYGPANPILSPSPLIPHRNVVTAETLADPAYRVMTDLIFRKHVDEQNVDVAALADAHTLTPAEVAERLGVNRSAVYQAIEAGRLSAWVKGGRTFIDPRALLTFSLSPRGPKSKEVRASTDPLDVRVGSADGKTMHVANIGLTASPAATPRHGDVGKTGLIGPWRRVGVFTGAGDRARFVILEPDEEANEINHGPFYVRGKFKVVEKINNSRKASEAFKAFEPA